MSRIKNKDLSPIIQKLLHGFINDHKDILCKVEVKYKGNKNYRVTFYLIGGYGSSNWPTTQLVSRKFDDLMNKAWELIYEYIGQTSEMSIKYVKSCDEMLSEELYQPSSDEHTPGKFIVHKSNPV